MTQPPTYPTPPAGGQPPAAGGFAPPAGPVPQGYAVPPQYAPPGWAPPPGYAYPPRPMLPPALAPNGQPLAGFGDRLLAYLVDAVIVGGVSAVLAIPAVLLLVAAMVPDLAATAPDGTPAANPITDLLLPLLALEVGLFAVIFALSYVYQVELALKTGQTVGKRVLKLKIVPFDPAAPLTRRVLAKRWLAHQGGGLIPGFSYLDGLWQLWDKPWQQCLHDKFARTVVVKVAP
ncbi:RDD family protein [Micromonospora sp. KC723]|uniref:RDD family protein n=1 Tax=Micromonospora sp. KC723 TaxID=2530381 RepID=UPI00104FE229|nr:RDD family protein [Micromonospora sp. KC723]TDB75236.1 RDD family protein [Micromonospora sp. KC723]